MLPIIMLMYDDHVTITSACGNIQYHPDRIDELSRFGPRGLGAGNSTRLPDSTPPPLAVIKKSHRHLAVVFPNYPSGLYNDDR